MIDTLVEISAGLIILAGILWVPAMILSPLGGKGPTALVIVMATCVIVGFAGVFGLCFTVADCGFHE